MRYKNLDRYLQQTNRLKTICPIYVKPPTALFNECTVRICTIVENKNLKENCFKRIKRTLLEQKYPKLLTEASVLRAKEIALEILWQPKTAKNEEIIPFTFTYNPNNPNVFPIIKESFDNVQYSKTMSNIFQRKKLVKSMSQTPNLEKLLCRPLFESQHKNQELKNYGKNCLSCPYLLKASIYQFKRVKKTFLLKNSFDCESSNLIYVVMCQGCKEKYI